MNIDDSVHIDCEMDNSSSEGTKDDNNNEEDSSTSGSSIEYIEQDIKQQGTKLGKFNPKKEIAEMASVIGDAITDMETYDMVMERMRNIYSDVIRENAKKSKTSINDNILVSFPDVDKRSKARRLTNPASPIKKKAAKKHKSIGKKK